MIKQSLKTNPIHLFLTGLQHLRAWFVKYYNIKCCLIFSSEINGGVALGIIHINRFTGILFEYGKKKQ